MEAHHGYYLASSFDLSNTFRELEDRPLTGVALLVGVFVRVVPSRVASLADTSATRLAADFTSPTRDEPEASPALELVPFVSLRVLITLWVFVEELPFVCLPSSDGELGVREGDPVRDGPLGCA